MARYVRRIAHVVRMQQCARDVRRAAWRAVAYTEVPGCIMMSVVLVVCVEKRPISPSTDVPLIKDSKHNELIGIIARTEWCWCKFHDA